MSKKYGPCQCHTAIIESREEVVDSASGKTEVVEGEFVYGLCGAQTKGTFAPGHDARLKGLLLKLIRSGKEFWVQDGGFLVTCNPLEELANHGWARFNVTPKARTRKEKVAKGAKTIKAEEAKVKGFYPVRVKIGRWTYDATITSENGDSVTVAFTTTKGAKKVATVKRHQLVSA